MSEWSDKAKVDYRWAWWTDLRVRRTVGLTKGKLAVCSDEVDDTKADVWALVQVGVWDRLWHMATGLTWLRDREWFYLLTVMDTRHHGASEVHKEDAYPAKGTGFEGLCEFDLEEATRKFLEERGIEAEVTLRNGPVS